MLKNGRPLKIFTLIGSFGFVAPIKKKRASRKVVFPQLFFPTMRLTYPRLYISKFVKSLRFLIFIVLNIATPLFFRIVSFFVFEENHTDTRIEPNDGIVNPCGKN